MNGRALNIMAFGMMLAATACVAQSQSPTAPAADLAHARDVVLNVTTLDGRGDPVTDLTRDDFQIYDDGKPQAIVSFQPGAAKPAAETPPPATLTLFDLLNSNNMNRDYVSTFIVRALEPLETADTVFLFLLTNHGEIYPIHDIPQPQQMAVLPRVRGAQEPASAPPPPWTRQIHALLDQAIQKVYGIRPVDARDPGYRAATTFLALSKLQEAFVEMPGPKTIVWITSGVTNWPDYPHGCKDMTITEESGTYVAGKCTSNCRGLAKCIDYAPFLQHFSSELSRANTLVYTAEDLPSSAMPSTARGTSWDTLHQLADLTGGRMYTGTNMDNAITEAMKNARGRYRIAIAAPAANGKHHKLRVTCARKDIRVDAPRGYFASEQ